MAQVLVKSHLNLGGNEIQNAVFQNLATAPQNPVEGQFYFNTTDGTLYVYNGTSWVDALSQGDYTFQNGIENVAGTRNVQIKLATGDNAGNVEFTADSNGLSASVAPASTEGAGVIEIATDEEFTTGTSETLAVNPKQVISALENATEGMVTEDGAQTLTNKTIDADSNTILNLETENFKDGVVTTILADASTASDTKLPTEKAVADAIADFITLEDVTIAAGSTDYLEYDSTTGEFGAKVDGTVTANSTNLVTSGAVATAIDNAIVGGVIYKGVWDATAQTDYSSITLPVKQGYMYYVSGGEDVTIGGITWNQGDYLLITEDVAADGEITSAKVQKIDNTEASDIVRLDATQTLTNKSISATANTISDLATDNFTASALATTISDTATASDTKLATEKAVADALADATDGMVTEDGVQTLTNKTIDADSNTIENLETDNFKSGVITTVVADASSALDTKLPSEKAVAEAIEDLIALDDITIAADSTDYLEYDSTTGEIGAKVDTTVTHDSTNLITSGAVATAIDQAVIGGVIYKGTWDATGQTDYSAITLPVKQGYMYYVSGGEDVTVEGIEWNAGDYLLVTEDVEVGETLTSAEIQKIDNTEASDLVRLNEVQTLTNKTISASDNTISDLGTGNFATGVVVTTIADTATASDTKIATEKAIAVALETSIEGMVTEDGVQTLTNKTIDADDNTIANLETDNFKDGVVVDSTVGIADTATASDTKLVTEKAIADALAEKTGSFSATNGALTPVAGVATWTVANELGKSDVIVMVKETATGDEVITNVVVGSANIIISFNADAEVTAGTYTVVVVG